MSESFDKGYCPVCKNRGVVSKFRLGESTMVASCTECNGIIAWCNNTPYIDKAFNYGKQFDAGITSCPICGRAGNLSPENGHWYEPI